jgi:hypothetical protein
MGSCSWLARQSPSQQSSRSLLFVVAVAVAVAVAVVNYPLDHGNDND